MISRRDEKKSQQTSMGRQRDQTAAVVDIREEKNSGSTEDQYTDNLELSLKTIKPNWANAWHSQT